MTRIIRCLSVLGMGVLLLVSLPAFAQQNPERLVLKDGSYQNVTEWEVHGDRVRYYSAERYTWEELPNEIIDWAATEKYNKERASLRSEVVEEATKEADAAEPPPPMPAPGLYLPDGGGVFLLDTYQSQPQLVELTQDSGELNKHTGKNILRAAINPLALSSKQTVELKGAHAQTQAHVTQPVIYLDVDTGSADTKAPADAKAPAQNSSKPVPAASPTPAKAGGLGSAPSMGPGASSGKASPANQAPPPSSAAVSNADHYRIVRMEQKKDSRILGNVNVAIYGKVSQKENWTQTVSQPVSGNWIKLTPAQPLQPGEYAVVELLDKGQVNLFVWDFGVNPTAPANAHAWGAKKSVTGQSDEKPGLEKRPPQ
ncbi:MAG TPA: hypothetical protein VJV96_09910 [Candidatus Angelobacter sp.]|nr:hypothetical protein [Candidatus Angelobacter sp.]